MSQEGLVQVYTGNGKGKTTAALGLALRAVGHQKRVIMFQFMKGDKEYGEIQASQALPGFTIVQCGRVDFVDLKNPATVDREMAQQGWQDAQNAITQGQYDIVILDEINVALFCGMIETQEVVAFLKKRPRNVEVILTGRYAPDLLLASADLVTEMQEIKHPYQQGIPARCGIEF